MNLLAPPPLLLLPPPPTLAHKHAHALSSTCRTFSGMLYSPASLEICHMVAAPASSGLHFMWHPFLLAGMCGTCSAHQGIACSAGPRLAGLDTAYSTVLDQVQQALCVVWSPDHLERAPHTVWTGWSGCYVQRAPPGLTTRPRGSTRGKIRSLCWSEPIDTCCDHFLLLPP